MRMNQEIKNFPMIIYFDFDIKYIFFNVEVTENSVLTGLVFKNGANFLNDEFLLLFILITT
jgi:hypothetical protein